MVKITNKKGVSEIVSYVLLIIIAVAISVLVYNFLINFIPKGSTPQCPDGISLIPESISCSSASISFNLTNRGLWNVSGAFIKGGTAASKIKSPISADMNPLRFNQPLSPGTKISITRDILSSAPIIQELEVSPMIINEKGETVICTNAIVLQPVNCLQ